MAFSRSHFRFFIFSLLLYLNVTAQSGIVSGNIGDESGPLPGVQVTVKGTSHGTETDFDGNYSIPCTVGDILVFSFVGMATREVPVTRDMFGKHLVSTMERPVNKIISDAYTKALKKEIDTLEMIPGLAHTSLTYNKKKEYLYYERIKRIKQEKDRVKITYFQPDIYFQLNFNTVLGIKSVIKRSLPILQNAYVQGRPDNGQNRWFGPETGEVFSFGPLANSLTFDGSDYAYDNNGRLIEGTGQRQILPYGNGIFNNAIVNSNALNLVVLNTVHNININLRRKTQDDPFGAKQDNLTQFDLNYKFKNQVSAFVKTSKEVNNQPNTNGFYSNLLLSDYLTPVSFENAQGYSINTSDQRSFSPDYFNNPLWLLKLNKNKNSASSFIAGLDTDIFIGEDLRMNAMVSYNREKSVMDFTLPLHTVGFKDGYFSKKQITNNILNGYLDFNLDENIENFSRLKIRSAIKYRFNSMDYGFLEQSGFQDPGFSNPTSENNNRYSLNNNITRLFNEVKLNFDTHFQADLTLKNNTVFSDLQGNVVFLPAVQGFIDVVEMLGYVNWISATLAFGFAKEANEMPLFYNNLSHNSLKITPEQSQSYLANNDLFNSKNLDLEINTTFDIESNIRLFQNVLNIGVNYYRSRTKNSIFPVYENEKFDLQNLASIKSEGVELSVSSHIRGYNGGLEYSPTLLFSKRRSKVIKLLNGMNSISIAGFSNISKNLIVGEQTGTIVGSSFLRDSNSKVIIDSEGFPMVNPEKTIIGNTTPDFNLSFNNEFKLGKFRLNFLIDLQKGGDVWNGTQNVLNYFGRSRETAEQRNITNYIFDGVTVSGAVNTTRVDFANPNNSIGQNRWVRYGYDGVAEEAIVDGSYINLRSVNLSYDFGKDNDNKFFRRLEIIFYAENLLLITKRAGISPYSSLFDHSAGSGLNYFNMPLFKEIGFKLNIKI